MDTVCIHAGAVAPTGRDLGVDPASGEGNATDDIRDRSVREARATEVTRTIVFGRDEEAYATDRVAQLDEQRVVAAQRAELCVVIGREDVIREV
jgi:hypothetical protein